MGRDMTELLPGSLLPAGFEYPGLFCRVVELRVIQLEPWFVLDGDLLRERREGMAQRYPTRDLVPFARREDNDDVACWDGISDVVYVVHDFASPGYEQRDELPNFAAWLRRAIDDLIEFEGDLERT